MSVKYTYTEDMEKFMTDTVASNGGEVTEDVINTVIDMVGHPRRSVSAKLRKMGYDVPKLENTKEPRFNEEETKVFKELLEENVGVYSNKELAEILTERFGKEVTYRQVSGKALSLDLAQNLRKVEKESVKTFTDEQEATIVEMVEQEKFIEEIAEVLNKTVPEVRGKLLSMKLKAKTRDKKSKTATKVDAYAGIEDIASGMTVEELAEKFEKTARGVKTVLTRRKIVCKDHPKNGTYDNE